MNKKCMQRTALSLLIIAAVLIGAVGVSAGPDASAAYEPETTTMKIGLYFDSDELSAANLLNYVGSGYTFGYYDSAREFHPVGETDETAITMLKDWNMYLVGDTYYDSTPEAEYSVVGCYHVRLAQELPSFEEARLAAEGYPDAFPAYHNGSWYVCVGSYTSASAAEAALSERGLDGVAMTASSSCVTVVVTGTNRIVFQFDYGTSASLAVRPRPDESGEATQTWFRKYRYNGDFQYTRLNGNNMTVVNVVDIEDYIKGVVPYEMDTEWPREALKAQAICARTYAAARIDGHSSYGFDLCNGTCCQVYYGTNSAGTGSDTAVEETAGQYISYEGKLCQIHYFSSDGGATENCENVFTEAIPYLRGVVDPYEEYVDTGRKNWSYTYTSQEITSILQMKGYNCADIVSITPTYTDMGNIYSLKFTDANGRNWTFSKYNASTILYSPTYGKYTYSMRFTVSGANMQEGTVLCVNSAANPLEDVGQMYAIGSGGAVQKVTAQSSISVMTGSGMEDISIMAGGTAISSDEYVISGSGWGHNVGMSQYGARAMAEQGLTYKDILEFYFTGVTVG